MNIHLSEQEFHDWILRTHLQSFLHRCLLTLNPGAAYLPNWHIQAIAYQLQRVWEGKITRLIINMPPRYLKSLTVSVAWPAYVLGLDPTRRIFAISYGNELSSKHSADFRSIVESPWYRKAFPEMILHRSLEDEVITSHRGFRKSTSLQGTLTGLGGSIFIIDDPLKPADAQSDPRRETANQWVSNTLISRLDNKATGAIIVVMQRVHLNDLTGYLTEISDDWTVLSLPAIAEADERTAIGDGEFYFRKAGEALHPTYEPLSTLEQLRTTLGPDIFAAQYQQRPVPLGGAMFKREWFRYYDDKPNPSKGYIIQSWDTAAKNGAQNDWSVCTTWQIIDNHYYLLDLIRARFEYPQLKATAVALAQKYKPRTILIEDASTGMALAPELRTLQVGCAVELVPIEHDKKGTRLCCHRQICFGNGAFPAKCAVAKGCGSRAANFSAGQV